MAGNDAVHGTNVVDSGVYGTGMSTGTTPDTARPARGSAKPHPIHTPHARICSAAVTPGEDCRDVRFGADARMAAGMRGGFVPDYNDLDLYQIHMDAEAAEGGHPRRAGAICMGLTESPGVRYNMIGGGAFWPLFGKCVEAMGGCMRRQDRRPCSEAKICMRSLPRFRPDATPCAPIRAQNRFPSAGSVASHFLKWPWVLLQRSVDAQSVRWWSNGMMGDCHSSDRGSIPSRRA